MTLDEEADEIVRRLKGIRPSKESDNILTVDISFTPVLPVKYITLTVMISPQGILSYI